MDSGYATPIKLSIIPFSWSSISSCARSAIGASTQCEIRVSLKERVASIWYFLASVSTEYDILHFGIASTGGVVTAFIKAPTAVSEVRRICRLPVFRSWFSAPLCLCIHRRNFGTSCIIPGNTKFLLLYWCFGVLSGSLHVPR